MYHMRKDNFFFSLMPQHISSLISLLSACSTVIAWINFILLIWISVKIKEISILSSIKFSCWCCWWWWWFFCLKSDRPYGQIPFYLTNNFVIFVFFFFLNFSMKKKESKKNIKLKEIRQSCNQAPFCDCFSISFLSFDSHLNIRFASSAFFLLPLLLLCAADHVDWPKKQAVIVYFSACKLSPEKKTENFYSNKKIFWLGISSNCLQIQ